MLEGVFNVLKWSGNRSEVLNLAEDRYASHLANLLGHQLGALETKCPDRAKVMVQLLESVGSEQLRRVIFAPEISFRLLWQSTGNDDDLWNVLERALNDARDGYACPPRIGGLVLDSNDAALIRIDPHIAMELSVHHYGQTKQREAALCKVAAAMDAIGAVDPGIAAFVRRFTLLASIVTDDEGKRFSSGSINQYVGRSILWNTHLPSVDVGLLAEALVHEAIHAYLYMHEACEPWFINHEKIPGHPVVASPWTGTMLRLESFLQACFVWFGLLHFWQSANRTGVFPHGRAEKGIALARSGFCKDPLLSYIFPLCMHVHGFVAEIVQRMQDHVLRSSRQSSFDQAALFPPD